MVGRGGVKRPGEGTQIYICTVLTKMQPGQ